MAEDRAQAGFRDEAVDLDAELETANRKLAEAYRMASLGRLIAGIAHEISTPVGSILSNNAVLRRSLDRLREALADTSGAGAARLSEALEVLETLRSLAAVDKIACERISAVVVGLKTFARVEEKEFSKVSLNDLLRSTLVLTHAEYRSRIALETDFGDLPEVECYPQALSQVFLTLLVNAAQSIDGRGTVKVQTRREGEAVRISISDTGSGIRPEDRPRMLQPGFTTKPVGVGTGLGLSISREIVVDRHGGSIDFESELGVGTTFHIRIPVRQGGKATG